MSYRSCLHHTPALVKTAFLFREAGGQLADKEADLSRGLQSVSTKLRSKYGRAGEGIEGIPETAGTKTPGRQEVINEQILRTLVAQDMMRDGWSQKQTGK